MHAFDRQTDRQTDGQMAIQTDRILIARLRLHCMQSGKIGWSHDKVKNAELLQKISVNGPQFCRNVATQKIAYAGHVLRRSSGFNAVIEIKLEIKIICAKTRGRPKRNCIVQKTTGKLGTSTFYMRGHKKYEKEEKAFIQFLPV